MEEFKKKILCCSSGESTFLWFCLFFPIFPFSIPDFQSFCFVFVVVVVFILLLFLDSFSSNCQLGDTLSHPGPTATDTHVFLNNEMIKLAQVSSLELED